MRYLVDPRVVDGSAWVTGADAPNRHVIDLVAGRDFQPDGTIDVAEVRMGDPCPNCGAGLELRRGIEIGHIFQLGQKYARALALEVAGPDGRPVVPTMGSYGIGVSRAVAAIAESTHDESGLCWPREVSPADLHLVAVGTDDPVVQVSEQLASDLAEAGIRVLYDDRAGVSAGVKFKDAELIGVPTVVVVGKALADGQVEVRDRRSRTTSTVPAATAADHLIELVAAARSRWGTFRRVASSGGLVDDVDGDFQRIWRDQRDHLWRVAWLICGDPDLADDVVGAAVARCWRGWDKRKVSDPRRVPAASGRPRGHRPLSPTGSGAPLEGAPHGRRSRGSKPRRAGR